MRAGRRGQVELVRLFQSTGQYVKVNEQWFRVIGVVSPQLSSQGDSSGAPAWM
jgi:hypothetical protein